MILENNLSDSRETTLLPINDSVLFSWLMGKSLVTNLKYLLQIYMIVFFIDTLVEIIYFFGFILQTSIYIFTFMSTYLYVYMKKSSI